MRLRKILWGCLGVVALLAPSACSSLPQTGEPHEFAIEAPQRDPVRQFGAAPQVGSSPTLLVEDFLRATAAGMYDDFATARLYLQPEASATWRPNLQVAVFSSDFSPSPELKDRQGELAQVSLSLSTVGTVNESGVLSVSVTPGSVSTEFTLTLNEDGEWRIAELADGVILSQSAFTNAYQNVNLLFPSSDLSGLVPDPRWYPRSRVAAYLMQGLIEGPVESLVPAVVGDLAADLTMPTAGVEVQDRVAMIDLEGNSSSSEAERSALIWQISQTVTQVASVQSVEIRLNGVELDESDVPSGPSYRLDRAVGLLDGAVVLGSTSLSTEIANPEATGAGAANPAIGPVEGAPVAWVNSEPSRLAVMTLGSAQPRDVPIAGVTAPSIDRFGVVWASSTDAPGVVWAVAPGREPVQVPVPFDGEVAAVRVSPDGSRALLLTRGSAGSQVWLATIRRNDVDAQYSFEAVTELDLFPARVEALTWVGETTVAALVPENDAESTIEVFTLGGWLQTLSAPPEISAITAGSTLGSLLVQRPDGTAFQRAGAAWIELDNSVQEISFAG